MAQELFRREVLDARRTSWLGGVSLAQPVRLWLLACAAIVAALAVAFFLVFGTYTRRSTVMGQLAPAKGLAMVLAPATGVIGKLEVGEGNRVAVGQALAVVTVPRATPGGGDTTVALERNLQQRKSSLESAREAQRQQYSAQASGLAAQLSAMQRDVAQLESGIATRGEQVLIARETLERLHQLESGKYVSARQIEQQESLVLDQVSARQALQRQVVDARRTIAQLRQAIRELPGQRQASEAGFQRDLATIEQEQLENEARGAFAISAPVAGVIANQLVKPGQAVQAGQPLLSVLPGTGELQAELLVPSRAIGFVEPGDDVLLRYQAYPYQKFGHQHGRVVSISRSPIPSGIAGAPGTSQGAGEPFYRVSVALDHQQVVAFGRPEELKPGMLLEADILGERRRLSEWLLEPLYSIRGKVGSS
jgi:membrane fusion protein